MLGCYDFCGHYEWTFGWFERVGGPSFLREYWRDAISRDSQRHARALIASGGFDGMEKYWGHTSCRGVAEFGVRRDGETRGVPD